MLWFSLGVRLSSCDHTIEMSGLVNGKRDALVQQINQRKGRSGMDIFPARDLRCH